MSTCVCCVCVWEGGGGGRVEGGYAHIDMLSII